MDKIHLVDALRGVPFFVSAKAPPESDARIDKNVAFTVVDTPFGREQESLAPRKCTAVWKQRKNCQWHGTNGRR